MNKNLAYDLKDHADASQGIQVDTGIAAPTGAQERRKITVPPGVKAALGRYREAYRKAFGIPPEAYYDGKWIRIRGQTEGVTMKRLREMIKQLRYRAS